MHTAINDNTFGRIGHHQASIDTDRWPAVIDAMARAFNSAVLFTPTADAARLVAAIAGKPQDDLGESGDQWVHDNVDVLAPVTALWPRLQRALHAFWLLHESRDVARFTAGTLDAMAHVAFVLRADGQIDFSNAAAQRAMTRHPAIVTGCGRLLRVGEVPSADLTGPRPPGFAAISLDGRLRRAQLFVTPIAEAAIVASTWPQAHCLLTVALPAADNPAAEQAWLNALGRHHGLTGAEVRVLGLLAGGQDAAAMSTSLNVSVATIRSHIRALFDKTGVRRQAELVRLALAG